MTIAILLAAAQAASCPAPQILGSEPAQGANSVGLGHPFVLLTPNDGCHQDLVLTLVDGANRRLELSSASDALGNTLRHRAPLDVLEAGQTYTVELQRASGGQTRELFFTTGSNTWSSPGLQLIQFDSDVVDAGGSGEYVSATLDVRTAAPLDTIVHWSGDQDPGVTWFAELGTGSTSERPIDAWSTTDEVCVHVRLEALTGELGPWQSRCHVVEMPEEPLPLDSGTPPLPYDSGTLQLPDHTGLFFEEGWVGEYTEDEGFILFACGGCSSTRGVPTVALLLPLLVGFRRRR